MPTGKDATLYTLPELAEKVRRKKIRVGASTLRKAAKEGRLDATLEDGVYKSTIEAVEQYWRNRPRMGRPPKLPIDSRKV